MCLTSAQCLRGNQTFFSAVEEKRYMRSTNARVVRGVLYYVINGRALTGNSSLASLKLKVESSLSTAPNMFMNSWSAQCAPAGCIIVFPNSPGAWCNIGPLFPCKANSDVFYHLEDAWKQAVHCDPPSNEPVICSNSALASFSFNHVLSIRACANVARCRNSMLGEALEDEAPAWVTWRAMCQLLCIKFLNGR